jgi:hypothetical protein
MMGFSEPAPNRSSFGLMMTAISASIMIFGCAIDVFTMVLPQRGDIYKQTLYPLVVSHTVGNSSICRCFYFHDYFPWLCSITREGQRVNNFQYYTLLTTVLHMYYFNMIYTYYIYILHIHSTYTYYIYIYIYIYIYTYTYTYTFTYTYTYTYTYT